MVAALAAVVAGIGCGSDEGTGESGSSAPEEEVEDPLRSTFETVLRSSAGESGELSDEEISCVISGTREEIDDRELETASRAQASNPGAEISDELRQDVEAIAGECGVVFAAP